MHVTSLGQANLVICQIRSEPGRRQRLTVARSQVARESTTGSFLHVCSENPFGMELPAQEIHVLNLVGQVERDLKAWE